MKTIVDIAELLKRDGPDSNKSSGVSAEEIRSLITELHKYGSIKSTMKLLSQKVDKLRNQVASLLTEKQGLDVQNQIMFSTLQYSKQLVGFFSGSCV